jgi:hypothetical protein
MVPAYSFFVHDDVEGVQGEGFGEQNKEDFGL